MPRPVLTRTPRPILPPTRLPVPYSPVRRVTYSPVRRDTYYPELEYVQTNVRDTPFWSLIEPAIEDRVDVTVSGYRKKYESAIAYEDLHKTRMLKVVQTSSEKLKNTKRGGDADGTNSGKANRPRRMSRAEDRIA